MRDWETKQLSNLYFFAISNNYWKLKSSFKAIFFFKKQKSPNISSQYLKLHNLSLSSKPMLIKHELLFYCHFNTLPQTQWIETTQINLTVLEVKSLKSVSVVSGNKSLPCSFPTSRSCLFLWPASLWSLLPSSHRHPSQAITQSTTKAVH